MHVLTGQLRKSQFAGSRTVFQDEEPQPSLEALDQDAQANQSTQPRIKFKKLATSVLLQVWRTSQPSPIVKALQFCSPLAASHS